MRNIILGFALLLGFIGNAQQTTLDTDTSAVQKHRQMGYPINVLEKLPVVKGCENLRDNNALVAICLRDQFNHLFARYMKGIEKLAEDKRGVSVYIEFLITKDGKISEARRVKVSEEGLDQFVRTQFERFRLDLEKNKLIVSPGEVYQRNVNTLYGVKFIQSFEK